MYQTIVNKTNNERYIKNKPLQPSAFQLSGEHTLELSFLGMLVLKKIMVLNTRYKNYKKLTLVMLLTVHSLLFGQRWCKVFTLLSCVHVWKNKIIINDTYKIIKVR